MPDTRYNAVANSANGSANNIQEGMWQLKIADDGPEGGDDQNQFPDRPGEPDCIYFMRTGMCAYGSKCRYNHPTYSGQVNFYRDELPQRDGQPDCQFFLKTGTCKFGSTCKYHHPRDKHDGKPIPLNILGLPIRKDEKSCPYYMRTTSCKFGMACKFNHPEPSTFGAMAPDGSVYGGYTSPMAPAAGPPMVGGPSPYLLSRNPRIQGSAAYMPLVVPPNTMQQGWHSYMGNVGIPSGDAPVPPQVPNSNYQFQPGSSASVLLPERPDQPECQYYMRTGNCKYGTSCKYHHPQDRNAAANIGPHGLPLRPGLPVCGSYAAHIPCKYGTACKFDHPVNQPVTGYYNYPIATYTVSEPPVFLANISPLTENSSSKTVKPSDKPVKTVTIVELPDTDNNGELHDDGEHDNPSSQTSPTHTAPHSDSPQNESD